MRKYKGLACAMLGLSGCAAQEALLASEAQHSLPGLTEADLQLCAGVPDRVGEVRDGNGVRRSYWTYQRNPASSGGLTINLPMIGGGFSLNGAGDCRATFELEQGRVTRLGYSGSSDLGPTRNAACGPVVRGCLDLLRSPPPGEPSRELPAEPAEGAADQPATGPDRPAISRISLRFSALPKLSKSSATMTKAPGPPITLSR